MSLNTENVLFNVVKDIKHLGFFSADFLLQIAVLLSCWGLAFLIVNRSKKRVAAKNFRWQLANDGVQRLLFPVLALIFVTLGNITYQVFEGQTSSLLRLANLLMVGLVNIRILVYIIRRTFEGATWVQRWERYIAAIIWIGYVLHVVGILPQILETLDTISFDAGKVHISILTVIQGLLSVGATLLIAMWIGRLIEQRLMSTDVMDMNVRVVLVKVMRSLLVVLAVLASLSMVGIDLTVLSVFGGALGVGLGFGLQKIASNYVSGFIILLDRSIKLGDLISVDNRQGIISGLTSRYIVLKAPDGTEALVPNDTLISQTVVNQSYNDRSVWVGLPIQVAYNSDLDQVMRLMTEITQDESRILKEPAPGAFVTAFADSGINLTLGFWLADPENGQMGLKSDLNMKIWRAFKANNIEIPYPRRDITILPGSVLPNSNV
ncbi:mechanosensitive ion channel family protein [Deefgea sp. CFH1-16]|uniref:mechanosensitive ion channel family protein n=1 Tax=Deefgea sp. CFH1-16 TaxID=2675457 RepID=UPI0015F37D02|nr:mechanosensitive ion channel domain-containing protein [Deefgea sp. CFH1-16]MBM5574637.1 mechanosensitive ion channel [Deefgea sp. CFH1-16]